MKAYSQDMRECVLRAVDQGIPRSEMVRVLGVSLASIGRYLKQHRETGQVQPRVCLTLREPLMHTGACVDAANQILLVHTFVA